jgi:hypothetical protein
LPSVLFPSKLQEPTGAVTLALVARNLSTELGANRLDITGCGRRGGSCTSASHLDGDDSTEGAGVGGVDDLDEADVGLAADGTAAGGAGGYGGREGVVLVDVGGALDDAHVDEHAGHEAALLGRGDVALGAGNLLGDGQLGAGAEGAGSGGVDDGGVWASSVRCDDVDGSGDGAA